MTVISYTSFNCYLVIFFPFLVEKILGTLSKLYGRVWCGDRKKFGSRVKQKRRQKKRICLASNFIATNFVSSSDFKSKGSFKKDSLDQTSVFGFTERNTTVLAGWGFRWGFSGHTLRSLTFVNDSITGSRTFLEKKTSQYALPTNPTRTDKPYPTLPRSANALVRQMPYL